MGTALTCFGEGEKADGGCSIMCSGLSSVMALQKQAEVTPFRPQRHSGVSAHISCSF